MKKVVLISCASKKLPCKTKAKNLYTSPLFRLNLRYANSLNPDKVFILSAKYGLLNLEQEVEPYNITLNNLPEKEIRLWAEKVLNFRIPLVCDGWLDVSWNSDSDQKPLEEWHLHATGL